MSLVWSISVLITELSDGDTNPKRERGCRWLHLRRNAQLVVMLYLPCRLSWPSRTYRIVASKLSDLGDWFAVTTTCA